MREGSPLADARPPLRRLARTMLAISGRRPPPDNGPPRHARHLSPPRAAVLDESIFRATRTRAARRHAAMSNTFVCCRLPRGEPPLPA